MEAVHTHSNITTPADNPYILAPQVQFWMWLQLHLGVEEQLQSAWSVCDLQWQLSQLRANWEEVHNINRSFRPLLYKSCLVRDATVTAAAAGN